MSRPEYEYNDDYYQVQCEDCDVWHGALYSTGEPDAVILCGDCLEKKGLWERVKI